jgi:glycosyltransferase involved in cell wall biosynthesis
MNAPVRTFTVVTPCFNAAALIRRTAESIVRQRAVRSGRVKLQYLVCDGGSTDGTLEVVRGACGDAAEIRSEKDFGMYDALAKGLRRATGDVVSYLNAGDVYFEHAFDVVADVVESGRAEWLTGLQVACNERGDVIWSVLPYRYRRELIRKAVYGTRLLPSFIQQESTFWSRRLLSLVDLDELARFRYAGDYYLWKRFAAEADLAIVDTMLGAFTFHRGQKSEDIGAYRAEQERLREPLTAAETGKLLVDAALWKAAPRAARLWLNRSGIVRYEMGAASWR